jgi:flagellar basal body-associated protein FliL
VTETELWAAWRIWMLVAGLVVLIAAALLVTIWLTARSIVAEASRALRAAAEIRDRTASIWELETTNGVAEGVLETVRRIESTGARLASELESHAGAS